MYVQIYTNLLVDQRLGRGEECDAAGGEPAREVVHDHGGDERLAHAGGQAHLRTGRGRPLRVARLWPHYGEVRGRGKPTSVLWSSAVLEMECWYARSGMLVG